MHGPPLCRFGNWNLALSRPFSSLRLEKTMSTTALHSTAPANINCLTKATNAIAATGVNASQAGMRYICWEELIIRSSVSSPAWNGLCIIRPFNIVLCRNPPTGPSKPRFKNRIAKVRVSTPAFGTISRFSIGWQYARNLSKRARRVSVSLRGCNVGLSPSEGSCRLRRETWRWNRPQPL